MGHPHPAMNKPTIVRLSAEQTGYLSDLIAVDPLLTELVRSRPNICFEHDAIVLDRSDAKVLHDYFGNRLARVGFDKDYEPNKEGVLLESLIDALFSLMAE
jgi:hypothetical protein